MAWTINNGKLYFNSVLYTGNGSNGNAITGVGFEPDWTWIKARGGTQFHNLVDVVRGPTKYLYSNNTEAEATDTSRLTAFGNDGFTLAADADVNGNGATFASWNWLAAGTAPSNTYAVKVVSDTGNKYRFDDFGTSAVTLEISEGGTFTFDQSDSSNNGHPLRFATQADAANSSQYTTGVTTNGTPGQAGAYTRITVAASAPTLFYYCTNHSGMGGQANTPVTNSFSSFNGSIQSNISPNTTSGFSIVKLDTGTSGNISFGHGLGVAPKVVIIKTTSGGGNWIVGHDSIGWGKYLNLNNTNAEASDSTVWQNTAPTNSVVTTNSTFIYNTGSTILAYCFADVQGYSKFGSYTGNGNANGTFIYTGFKPAFFLGKRTNSTGEWFLLDNRRSNSFNPQDRILEPDSSSADISGASYKYDFVSNGIKIRTTSGAYGNGSGDTYIYMAFAENPFTSSAGTPVTAR